jgi:hypothetical protein
LLFSSTIVLSRPTSASSARIPRITTREHSRMHERHRRCNWRPKASRDSRRLCIPLGK